MYNYYAVPYRVKTAVRRNVVKSAKMDTVFGVEMIWALAAYADRVNQGKYIKETVRDPNTGVIITERNRDIIKEQSQAGSPDVTEVDFETGRAARKWHQARLVFKTLSGEFMSDFDRELSRVVQLEEFATQSDKLGAAMVASQIASYYKGIAQEALMETVDRSPLAAVGAKVTVEDVTVTKSVYSMNYNVHFITAKTKCNRLVFFSYREKIDIGTQLTIRGTVKSHRPDSTQLTRVKVL